MASDHVLRKIETMLAECDLALFDVTNANANVTLELGIAIAAKHPYIVAIRADALNTLGADIHGWDQLRYKTVEELGTRLRVLIEQRRVPARDTSTKARLWVFTGKPASVSGGPSVLPLHLTVSNEGKATANNFTLRLYWSPHRAQRGNLSAWSNGGTYTVPYYERHFNVPVYPGARYSLPVEQVQTGAQGFSTTEIGWAISYADGKMPMEDDDFMPLTNAVRSDQNEQSPFRPN